MLILRRRVDQEIMIGDDISIMVTELTKETVKIGVKAPRSLAVHRREVYDLIKKQAAEGEAGGELPKTA